MWAEAPANLSNVYRDFPRTLRANAGVVPQLGHGSFLSHIFQIISHQLSHIRRCRAGLSNAAPVIHFPGALIYSPGFNVNQKFKKEIFLNNNMFPFFS
jgi:hypothetical protein